MRLWNYLSCEGDYSFYVSEVFDHDTPNTGVSYQLPEGCIATSCMFVCECLYVVGKEQAARQGFFLSTAAANPGKSPSLRPRVFAKSFLWTLPRNFVPWA